MPVPGHPLRLPNNRLCRPSRAAAGDGSRPRALGPAAHLALKTQKQEAEQRRNRELAAYKVTVLFAGTCCKW